MKKVIILSGFAIGYLFSIVMFLTFLQAYSSPTKSILITINKFGEANIELVLTTFMIILITITFFGFWREDETKGK